MTFRGLDACNAVVRDPSLVPHDPEHHGQALRRVPIIVDDEDTKPALATAAIDPTVRLLRLWWQTQENRQAYDELASGAGTVALSLDTAAVHFHQRPNESQANAEPSLRALKRPVHLGKHVEDLRQHVGGNTDALVL